MWPLEWGSSSIDWCEGNFRIVDGIAEFYNTISNFLFLLVPPLLIYLFRHYSKEVTKGANVVFILLFTVGLGSIYFHMTLSLAGQLIDEIAILWVLMAAIAVWFPKRWLPNIFQGNRKLFQQMIAPLSVISTGLCCVLPQVNAFILMLFGGPIVCLLIDEYKRSKNWKARSLAMRSAIIWFLAVFCWVNDKFLCDAFWFHFPYLHSGWHVFIFISAYTACVLFAYFQVKSERPELEPQIRYWPKEGGCWDFVGVPYVTIKCSGCAEKGCKTCAARDKTAYDEKVL